MKNLLRGMSIQWDIFNHNNMFHNDVWYKHFFHKLFPKVEDTKKVSGTSKDSNISETNYVNVNSNISWYEPIFPKEKNSDILISNLNEIKYGLLDEKNGHTRILKSQQNIDSIFSNNYLSKDEIKLLSKNRLQTIIDLKDKTRESSEDRPYSMHTLSVEYLLSLVNANFKTRFTGMNHDNIEELRGERTQFSIDDLAKYYTRIQKTIDSTFIDTPQNQIFSPKDKLELCIRMHKVTRLETDSDYYKSIDRLFDTNISYKTEGLEGAYFEYLKDLMMDGAIPFDKNFPITLESIHVAKDYIQILLEENKNHLGLSKSVVHNSIAGSAMGKLADRISNTIDDYEGKQFSSHLKDAMKNLYLINGLTNYLTNHNGIKYIIGQESYNALKYLRNMLINVTDDMLNKKIDSLVEANSENKHFKHRKDYADEQRKEYRKLSGFTYIDKSDSGGSSNLYEKNIVTFWNKVMKGDKKYESELNRDSREQYVALTSLQEIIKNYRKNNNFILTGFENVK